MPNGFEGNLQGRKRSGKGFRKLSTSRTLLQLSGATQTAGVPGKESLKWEVLTGPTKALVLSVQ